MLKIQRISGSALPQGGNEAQTLCFDADNSYKLTTRRQDTGELEVIGQETISKRYRVRVENNGTIVGAVINTIGAIAISQTGVGTYRLTSTGLFVGFVDARFQGGGSPVISQVELTSSSFIDITINDASGAPFDNNFDGVIAIDLL